MSCNSFQSCFGRLLLGLALLVAAGCAGRKPQRPTEPLQPPDALTRVDHFVGSPLSGPTDRTLPAPPPAEALSVRVSFIALENVPSAGVPLGAEARLITATRLGTPVLPSSQLTGAARIVPLVSADGFQAEVIEASGGRATRFLAAQAALPRGMTAVFEVRDRAPFALKLSGVESSARMQLYVHRPADTVSPDMPQPVEIAVAMEDLAPLPEDMKAATDGPARQAVQREIALFDRQVSGAEALAITVPFALGDSSGRAIGAVIELVAGEDSTEHLETLSSAMEQSRASASRVAGRPTTMPVGRNQAAAMKAAAASLATGTDRLRPTVVYLAGQTGARLCEDVALVADDSVLVKLAESARAALESGGGESDAEPSAIGWLLDKSAFQLLAKLMNDGKLPPELAAVLSSHAGEAGRSAASLEEVSRDLSSRQNLDTRLVAENQIYLEDSAPSARVRAYDWLNARGRAPAGFNPLGTPKERRDALEQAATAPAR